MQAKHWLVCHGAEIKSQQNCLSMGLQTAIQILQNELAGAPM
jgi:hypothetical protein